MSEQQLNAKIQKLSILQEVLREIGVANQEAEKIKAQIVLKNDVLLPILESQPEPKEEKRVIVYIAKVGLPKSAISPDDIAPIGSMLAAIGRVKNLDLILHSPGGNGVVAEKIVHMCRQHCTGFFRVIVPNMAKSAATLIALGADEIVMGYFSELGPIDPQKIINVSGIPQQVSAQAFLDARKNLLKDIQKARRQRQDITGYLQQLASSSMDPAFTVECQREIDFAKDFVKQHLPNHMLQCQFPKMSLTERKRRASTIARNLVSTNKRFVHGRMIGVQECKSVGLNVLELSQNDSYWEKILELYVRAEVFMMVHSEPNQPPASKLFADANSYLLAY